jgi:hypothetical protein
MALFAAGQRVLASQLNLLGQLPAAPTTTASSGTITSAGTETRDDVLGPYQFPAVSGARYRVVIDNLKSGTTVANDLFALRIRQRSDSTTPTAADTLVAESQALFPVTGGPGQVGCSFSSEFVASVTGTNTLAFFAARLSGTGTFTPLSSGVARQLYVIAMGTT